MNRREQEQLLYRDIAFELQQEIIAGRLRGRLPSERVLALRYGVSRVTLRRALQLLLDEKIIHRLARKGTFVGRAPENDIAEAGKRLAFFFCGNCQSERYETALLTGLSRCCSAAGEHLFIESFADGHDLRRRLPGIILREAPELVLLGGEVTAGMLEFIIANRLAVILLSPVPVGVIGQNYDLCCLDWYSWGYQATRYFIAHGYRRIALICGVESAMSSRAVSDGVEAACEEDGLKRTPEFNRYCNKESGRRGFDTLLELVELEYPDAVICSSEALGQGVTAGVNYLAQEHRLPLIMPKAVNYERFGLGQVKYLDFTEADAVKKCRQLVEYRLQNRSGRFKQLSPTWNFYDS